MERVGSSTLLVLVVVAMGFAQAQRVAKDKCPSGGKHQREFVEGLAAVGFDTSDTIHNYSDFRLRLKWGFAAPDGSLVVEPQYESARDFSEGLAAVENPEHRWGFIGKRGDTAIPLKFDDAYSFKDGLARVRVGKGYGFINKRGEFAIQPQYPEARHFTEALALVRLDGPTMLDLGRPYVDDPKQERWAYIRPTGETAFVFPQGTYAAEFDGWMFSEGLAAYNVIGSDGHQHCGYFDASGKTIIEPQFSLCAPFINGKAKIVRDGWHCIDRSGTVLGDADDNRPCK